MLLRSTYQQALFDTSGTQTMIAVEALEAIFPGDFDQNDPDVFFVADMVKTYQQYTSTRPDGICQMMVNGDGRSVLCDVPTVRSLRKFRTSRFVTNDPSGVKRLNQQRIDRMIADARGASNMRAFSVTRQPELAGELDAMFLNGLNVVTGLMAPIEPTLALQAPTPPVPPATDAPAAAATPEEPATPSAATDPTHESTDPPADQAA